LSGTQPGPLPRQSMKDNAPLGPSLHSASASKHKHNNTGYRTLAQARTSRQTPELSTSRHPLSDMTNHAHGSNLWQQQTPLRAMRPSTVDSPDPLDCLDPLRLALERPGEQHVPEEARRPARVKPSTESISDSSDDPIDAFRHRRKPRRVRTVPKPSVVDSLVG
jgi:hypothetical protein